MMFIRRDLVFADLVRFSAAMKERYGLQKIEPYEHTDCIGYAFERFGDPSEYVMVQSARFDEHGDVALVDKKWVLFQNGNVAVEGLPSLGHVFDWLAEQERLD